MHPTMQPVSALPAALPVPYGAREVPLDKPKVHHVPAWSGYSDPQRLAYLRTIVAHAGRDPRIATLAVQILREAGVEPRNYAAQASALLKWVQHRIYYVNEPGERLQDPLYTLKVGYGDCDDMAILLASFFETLAMPWRFVISGIAPGGKKVRFVEGSGKPTPRAQWSHIYVRVGWPPFQPQKWAYAEPTLRSAMLGWDVVAAGGNPLPEMKAYAGAGESVQAGAAAAGASMIDSERRGNFVLDVLKATATGVAVTVLSSVILQRFFPNLARENPRTRKNARRRPGFRTPHVITFY